MQHSGSASDGLHALVYWRGTFLLSGTQLDGLGEILGIEGQDRAAVKLQLNKKLEKNPNWRRCLSAAGLTPPPPCAWNMLLRRRYAHIYLHERNDCHRIGRDVHWFSMKPVVSAYELKARSVILFNIRTSYELHMFQVHTYDVYSAQTGTRH